MRNKRNRVNVVISGKDYSKYLSLPFVFQDTGTEQLDSAIIELRGMPTEAKFRPFEAVSLCDGKYTYVVADDTVTEIYGRGLYNHELTLIDATKMAERELMEAKNFTQPLFRDIGTPQPAEVYYYQGNFGLFNKKTTIKLDKTNYKSPILVPAVITEYGVQIFSVDSVASLFGDTSAKEQTWTVDVYYNANSPAISPEIDESVFANIYSSAGEIQDTAENLGSFLANKGSGIYTVRYNGVGLLGAKKTFIVPISVYDKNEIEDMPAPYSVVDVLKTLLETVHPLFTRDTEQDYIIELTAQQYERWSAIESPEFHFANGRSLYENLKEVGDFVHALPKIKIVNGQKTVYFQDLGKRTQATCNGIPYGSQQQFSAADYANAVEANFQNLINAVDENDGSVTEPFQGGYITLRSDGSRIKEEASYIPTNFPIGSKITRVIVSGLVGVEQWYENAELKKREHQIDGELDITPAIFEENEYALLSSFSGSFPFSKTYALYYKTGERNVQGLWYRAEDNPVDLFNAFKRYSITNVLNHFLGEDYSEYVYTNLKFQVTYIPFINGRARQERTEFLGGDRMVLTHNQSANQLSASAFGENLRGKVAMLANPSESKQYLFKSLDDVPKAGYMLGDKEFISLVTTRVFPDFCISQIVLSENYNNIGACAQMKTGIRQYEIPEGETRCTLIEEFCEIGNKNENASVDMLCQDKMKRATVGAFDASTVDDIAVSQIETKRYLGETVKTIANNIALPVYSAALGNSVYFGFKFDDNYKAGSRSIDIGLEKARGTEYVEYASARHAKADLLSFSLYGKLDEKTQIPIDTPYTLPSVDNTMWAHTSPYISTQFVGDLIWNKDSADSASIAYQLHFCSNDDYIITSELSKMMPYIRTSSNESRKVYAFFYDGEIDAVTGIPNGSRIGSGTVNVDMDNLCLNITKPAKPYKSFIIARNDEKCIIGKNTDNAPEKIYFNFMRKRG